jgi:hypothetical protein
MVLVENSLQAMARVNLSLANYYENNFGDTTRKPEINPIRLAWIMEWLEPQLDQA